MDDGPRTNLSMPQIYRRRHRVLHGALDALVAAYMVAHPKKLPSTTSVFELMTWSHQQTLDGAKPNGG